MNKVIPAIATCLALAAGGAGLYLAQKPATALLHAGENNQPVAADYLPAETLSLLALPDPGKAFEHWKTTDLYKIWQEPQVQAFLARPLSKVPPNPQLETAWSRIVALNPKNLFVALTALDEKDNKPHLIGGFQFKGTKEDVERLLADAKKQLRDSAPAGKADLIEYQSHAIETFDLGANGTVAATYLGDWYLVSNDTVLLKATLDRADHRAPGDQPSLGKDADFQAVNAQLPAGSETLIFTRVQSFMSRFYTFAAASGQTVDPEQRAESDKARAVGASTSIENGKIRDTIYVLAPGLKQDYAHLRLSSLPLSSTDTLLYLATALKWPEKFNFLNTGSNDSGGNSVMQGVMSALSTRGITADTLRASFGNEGGIQLDWPAASLQPSLLVNIEVRDRAAAQKLVDQLTSVPLDDLPWQTEQVGGQIFHTINVPSVSTLQPTLALTDKHVIIGLDAQQVREAITREGAGGTNFTAGEPFKTATALVNKGNATSAYLDAKGMFEKTYGLLRPYAIMGAAFLPPKNTEYVDLNKLPEIDTIARHLSPTVLSQNVDKDGAKLESVGTLTFPQFTVGAGGLAGVTLGALSSTGLLQKYLPGASAKHGTGRGMRKAPVKGAGPVPEDSPEPDASAAPTP